VERMNVGRLVTGCWWMSGIEGQEALAFYAPVGSCPEAM
jgi:hypothetical protein